MTISQLDDYVFFEGFDHYVNEILRDAPEIAARNARATILEVKNLMGATVLIHGQITGGGHLCRDKAECRITSKEAGITATLTLYRDKYNVSYETRVETA